MPRIEKGCWLHHGPSFLPQAALMVGSGWLVAAVLLRGEWRYVLMALGALCVMTSGVPLMQQWSVDSWDCRLQVDTTHQ